MNPSIIGIGPTKELSLRVSIAALARVTFTHPENSEMMLALEQKASLQSSEGGPDLRVKAQPFGGALRILKINHLKTLIGDFQFDSLRSHSEQDFRLFIRPSNWESVRDFCLGAFVQSENSALEIDPVRELGEEFEETMGLQLVPDQYDMQPIETVVNEAPEPTRNAYAAGYPTARIYRIFEVRISDTTLIQALVENSKYHTVPMMRALVFKDAQKGGRGRANAVMVASLDQVRTLCSGITPERRNRDFPFMDTILDANVWAILSR
jgi:hypothetical protein